jgi:hypothetical protein
MIFIEYDDQRSDCAISLSTGGSNNEHIRTRVRNGRIEFALFSWCGRLFFVQRRGRGLGDIDVLDSRTADANRADDLPFGKHRETAGDRAK